MWNFSAAIGRMAFLKKNLLLIVATYLPILLILVLLSLIVPDGKQLSYEGSIFLVVMIGTLLIVSLLYGALIMRQRCNDVTRNHQLLLFAICYLTPAGLALFFIPGYKERA